MPFKLRVELISAIALQLSLGKGAIALILDTCKIEQERSPTSLSPVKWHNQNNRAIKKSYVNP